MTVVHENQIINQDDEYKFKTRDLRAVKSLRILVALASLYTLYFAQSLIVPLLVSSLIALLLSQLVSKLQRAGAPRFLSSAMLLTILVTPFTILGIELAEPAERWIELIPTLSEKVTHQLEELDSALTPNEGTNSEPEATKTASVEQSVPTAINNEESLVKNQIKRSGLAIIMAALGAAPMFIAQMLGSFILTLFLLTFGPSLFKVFIHDFPIVKNKQRANHLVSSIRHALSRYIVTVSLINTGLGFATALGLMLFGVEDAILWGAIVGLFNFVPYIGSIVSLTILLIVGLVQFGASSLSIVPASIFMVINIVESQIVTPSILGKNMRVNPLIIIIWLFVSGWLWGVLGVLLAVPLLVCIKLSLDQMETFPHWVKFIEAR